MDIRPPERARTPLIISPVAQWKLPSGGAGEDDPGVCADDLNGVQVRIDHEEVVGRKTCGRKQCLVSAGAVRIHGIGTLIRLRGYVAV